ncbi:hypothetical protein Q8F55_005425 [Vanrija albida]|uniref:Uncharacterized protein n=1 Tax=Vanrija albida TaxID=181172 RepID=A0ABR3Q1X7_9TREE
MLPFIGSAAKTLVGKVVDILRYLLEFPPDGDIGDNFLALVEPLLPNLNLEARAARAMLDAASASGDLKPGQTVVQMFIGGTGTGLAEVCAERGLPFVAVMSRGGRGYRVQREEILELGGDVEGVDQVPGSDWRLVSRADLAVVELKAQEITAKRAAFRADHTSGQKLPRTRVEIIAAAPSPNLHWGPSTNPTEGGDEGADPFTEFRSVFTELAEEDRPQMASGWRFPEGEEMTGRPHFYGVTHIGLDSEFEAFLEALNSSPLDTLTLMLKDPGLFPSLEAFVTTLVGRLKYRPRRLAAYSLSESLSSDIFDKVQPFFSTWPHTIDMDEVRVTWVKEWDWSHPRWFDTTGIVSFFGKVGVRARKQLGYDTGTYREHPASSIGRWASVARTNYRFQRQPDWPMIGQTFRSLVLARILLLAKPGGTRTGIADLPAELIGDIVRRAAPYPVPCISMADRFEELMWGRVRPRKSPPAPSPDLLSNEQWATLLRHAGDREAFARVAAEFARLGVKLGDDLRRTPVTLHQYYRQWDIRQEFLHSGGFRRTRGPPEKSKLRTFHTADLQYV